MLKLLCISDLHLGEKYSLLDITHVRDGDCTSYSDALRPFRYEVAALAGLEPQDEPKVQVHTLVLLGDIFELATALLPTAAEAGRSFFDWLFGWLEADEVVYVPGNHDHVFWMWWKTCIQSGQNWWQADPQGVKEALARAYEAVEIKASAPGSPEPVASDSHGDLLKMFFGEHLKQTSFSIGYPVYCGPSAVPAGYSSSHCFNTIFTHGHLNDPRFVRPADLISKGMHALSRSWDAKTGSLAELEATTWPFTNKWWYPPKKETSLGERLYLLGEKLGEMSEMFKFKLPTPCRHLSGADAAAYPYETPPDLMGPDATSPNDFYSLLQEVGPKWYLQPLLLVYGHTHHGGAMPLPNPLVLVCNTGGWLTIVADRPVHTHMFAINDSGVATMKRVDFQV